MPARKLIIFVKAPRVGLVKTRLARSIGQAAACAAYKTLVETLVQKLSPLGNVELRYTPDDALAEIQPWRRSRWSAQPQGAGDLGARLDSAFQSSFEKGVERVVIIGSDCPAVSDEDIENS